jgi:CTP synthase (UTP-ammonia lyase)
VANPFSPAPPFPLTRIALVGDHDPSVVAHQGIPRALALAVDAAGEPLDWEWLHTSTLAGDVAARLAAFDGIWCVPGSPYADTAGALAAIRVARERDVPFLGTCGGFQHALLDYAAAAWGVRAPAHAELDPDAADPVIAPLICGLVEQTGAIRFAPGSRLLAIHGRGETVEGYHCRYGLNPAYAARLGVGPLRVAARDLAGDVRAVELDGHPFFVATLYQPERSGLAGTRHPLIAAFVDAARAHATTRPR